MKQQAYLRHPTLRDDSLVFVSDDDLWSVGASGGVARRLTSGLSEPSTPCLSPDGRWIAFVGRDEQHPEVYLMPAVGGPARRLTWLGPDVLVRGWTPEGRIVFVSTHGQPFFRNYRAFTLDPQGGAPQLLPLGQVNHLSFGPGSARVIGRNTADPARWKRYRGGTAGHLWIDVQGGGEFRRMSELQGNLTSPMWLGSRIYFLSDAQGVGNLYSCLTDGSGLRRHSDHGEFYARHAQSDGQRIVYQCGAEVWLFDPQTDQTRRLDIEVAAYRAQTARRFVPAAEHLGDMQLHPAGHSVALEVRGKLFSFALWEGAVRQHGVANGARYRHGQWMADGKTLVAATDESGEERITVFEGARARQLPWDVGRVTSLLAAPRGQRIALANHRNEVVLGDLATGRCSVIERSEAGRCEDLAWSADAGWLAYSFWTSARHTAIKLHDVERGGSSLVTAPEFRDYCPSFDPQGRYLYFLSRRTFDPVYDSVQFELSFPRAARPYLVALQAGGSPPFEPVPKGLGAAGREADTKVMKADGGALQVHPAEVHIDLEGIVRRVAPFPVAENRFGRIAGAAGGKVVWTVLPIAGAHGRGGHKETPGRLEVFDLAIGQAETLVDAADGFVLGADHETLLVREGKRLRAVSVDQKPESKHETGMSAGQSSRKSGWVDLERLRVSVEPPLEWRQMFREVWRLQRDQFWVADMSGVDWEAIYRRYAPLVDRVATRGELSDLVWELQGELGTSHAYEMGGDHRRPPQVALGHLGAELRFVGEGHGYEIVRTVAGDPWDAGADSPLNAVGVEARVGERIVAVNGQPVSLEQPPQALLVHQAGAKVLLTLASGDAAAPVQREVVVSTLSDEVPARYREWVETNRRWVHEASGGRVGYFHLPDMMAAGFAEFHRYFSTECDRDALIVDVRYNRGGHVSSLLLEKVARKRIGYNLQRWGLPGPYPEEAVSGPVVALTNEHAGSDGDIFSHSFKLMGIGPLVGTRTWGGVIGIWPRHNLVDGTQTTQPEFSFWFNDVGWGVENYGTDPQIEVDNSPQDAAANRDRQLETALQTALQLLERAGVARPRFAARPALSCPALPPRN
jgi:tricorn protease